MNETIRKRIAESIKVKNRIIKNEKLLKSIEELSNQMTSCIKSRGKIVICGNGGSASDALHFAGEIVGRFQLERNPWPAVALNADIATMTAIANDYGYDNVFERQARALVTDKDIFIGISTSGNSENVLRATVSASKIGAITAALLGKDGGKIGMIAQYPIIVPSDVTARIQESHITIIHILCELTEANLKNIDISNNE